MYPLFTIEEAAEHLEVSVKTIYNLLNKKEINTLEIDGKTYLQIPLRIRNKYNVLSKTLPEQEQNELLELKKEVKNLVQVVKKQSRQIAKLTSLITKDESSPALEKVTNKIDNTTYNTTRKEEAINKARSKFLESNQDITKTELARLAGMSRRTVTKYWEEITKEKE